MDGVGGSGVIARKTILITDLDHSDGQQFEEVHKSHRAAKPKSLKTISGNFSRRSRSAECAQQQKQKQIKSKENCKENSRNSGGVRLAGEGGAMHQLLQSKDKQLEELLKRLKTLHKYNDQFAEENKRLNNDVKILSSNVDTMKRQLQESVQCENCTKLYSELSNAIESNKALENDVLMMKTLVYRLNMQIERYQDKLRNTTDASSSADNRIADNPPAQWGGPKIHSQTLEPLLKSYDEMIKDKDDLIQQHNNEFETFTGKLKMIVDENLRLQQDNDKAKKEVSSWREERTRLQAQIDVCRSKADVQTRKADLAKEKLVKVMQCYEQKMQALVLDLEQMQTAYGRCKGELISMKNIASTTPSQATIVTKSLQECKELLEELKSQHKNEKTNMESSIEILKEQNATYESECVALKTDNFELKKQLDIQNGTIEELRQTVTSLQRITEKAKNSRNQLKARLRIALQWAQKLEEGQVNIQSTWDALKRLEQIVKHKESQVRGLHARHLEEIDKMQKKLQQKEQTIKTILRGKAVPTEC